MRIALDTNILVYAEGVNGEDRRILVSSILKSLADAEIVIPVQALGELFTVLTRKARRPATDARAALFDWRNAYEVADTSSTILFDAVELAAGHRFSLWDAIMVAVAAHAGCRFLLSEDMQDGFIWRGVTIRNPFLAGAVPGIRIT